MSSLKLDIEKINRIGDFGIWRRNIRVILVQQKVVDALIEALNLQQIPKPSSNKKSWTQPSLT